MLTADRIVSTTCPYCGAGCQIDLHIKNEMIFRVNGRFDNQVNHGNLCVKGRFGYDYVHAPDRLRQPLQRASRNDDLAAAPWDEALDTVATRLRQIRDSYGPDRAMRYNAFPAADINGAAAPGVSSGEAQAAIARIVVRP